MGATQPKTRHGPPVKKPAGEPPVLLGRDAILAAEDLRYETVAVPEWGGAVSVKTLSAAERDMFDEECYDARVAGTAVDVRSRLVRFSVVDADGAQLFSADDLDKLGRKSSIAMNRIFTAAQRLSGIGAPDIEVLEGN